ncbi:MAG: hypothetical protein PHQ62_01130 [Clostridia bacterium]|nr:hypothetical protein [Clostridia bacterium]
MIANDEDFDATVQIAPKNNKNERTIFAVSQKSKKGNRVFKSEHTISTFWLNDLPEFYIDSISCISVLDLQVKENTN